MNLLKMQFGSHVYGTSLPTSDHDFKAIFLPNAREIVLQRAPQTQKISTKADPHAKNTADDIDTEHFSLQRYLGLLMEGQTVALDMLFVPERFYTERNRYAIFMEEGEVDIWDYIKEHKDKFIHSGVSAFAGYCRQQANKYGIKGSRMATVKTMIELLKECDPNVKLSKYQEGLSLRIYGGGNLAMEPHPQLEHAAIVMCKAPNGREEPHLEVCNRKFPFHATVKYVLERLNSIYNEYGHRAQAAESNQGVDWKALMHAVRVQEEARELLSTGKITFPRPEAELLLAIRQGHVPYKDVALIIEMGLEDLEQMQLRSTLRKEPDRNLANDIVFTAYRQTILDDYLRPTPS